MLVKMCGLSFVTTAKFLIVSGILAFYINFVLLGSQVMFFIASTITLFPTDKYLFCDKDIIISKEASISWLYA